MLEFKVTTVVVYPADSDNGHLEDEVSAEWTSSIEEPELVRIEEEVIAIVIELEGLILWDVVVPPIAPSVTPLVAPLVTPPPVTHEDSPHNNGSETPLPLPLGGTLAGTRLTLESICTMC